MTNCYIKNYLPRNLGQRYLTKFVNRYKLLSFVSALQLCKVD